MSVTQTESNDLRVRYEALKETSPGKRIRDAARELGVSEAQLLALDCGDTVRRLRPEFVDMLHELHRLGRVMTLTRNDHAVHERKGEYKPVEINGPMGIVTDKGIDLRLFMKQWASGFAVRQPKKDGGVMESLQFFDPTGLAIHKVYLQDGSDRDAYEDIAAHFLSADQSPVQEVLPATPPQRAADVDVDQQAFVDFWKSLKDTHGFFGMLRKFKVSRTQALRLVEGTYTRRLENGAHRAMLEAARDQGVPIMVFVGSPGVIQIHTGEVKNLKAMGDWYNVLDPDFNLHLLETGITETWAVEKCTSDGPVTSVEIFDEAGRDIALFFGARKPGTPELKEWQAIVQSLT